MKKAGAKSCRRMGKMRGGGYFDSWIPSFLSPKTPDATGAPVAPVAPAAGATVANANAIGMLGGKKCKSRKCKK